MLLRLTLLLSLAVYVLSLSGCANDTSVKTPVPPAPANHAVQN